jgi:DNA-directed RNA polymerase specialized sigma24 family protein
VINDERAWLYRIVDRIGGLPDDQATAVKLVYLHGLAIHEAAAWTGKTTNETSAALSSGLRRLGQEPLT